MKSALIIGGSGQDGTLLNRALKGKGYRVTGLDRARGSRSCDEFLAMDVRDVDGLRQVVRETSVDEIYYLAAYHRSSQASTSPNDDREVTATLAVNLHPYVAILETVAESRRRARVFYACSSLIHGEPSDLPINESTAPTPRCPYGIAKLAALHVSEHFRHTEGVYVSVGILFNHESVYRPSGFLSQRIASGVRAIKEGASTSLVVGDLASQCDWGYAGDYVEAMWRMVQQQESDTYVVATGELHTVREWVVRCSELAGLDAETFVREDASLLRARRPALVGDSTKLRQVTGWRPSIGFAELVRKIYEQEE